MVEFSTRACSNMRLFSTGEARPRQQNVNHCILLPSYQNWLNVPTQIPQEPSSTAHTTLDNVEEPQQAAGFSTGTPQKLARIELRLPMASLKKLRKLNGKYLPPLAS